MHVVTRFDENGAQINSAAGPEDQPNDAKEDHADESNEDQAPIKAKMGNRIFTRFWAACRFLANPFLL